MSKSRHRAEKKRANEEKMRSRRKVSETTSLMALTNGFLNQEVQFYDYKSTPAQFLHKEKLQQMVNLITDRTNNLVIGDEQLSEYTKRGNILTQINKIVDELKAQRTQLHRQAKQSYSQFDKEIGSMIDTLTEARGALKVQVDALQKQKQEEKTNQLENVFNTIKEDFIKNDTTNTEYLPATFDFTNWFTTAKLRLSQKKAKEAITDYIASQAKDYQTFINLINKDVDNKKVLFQVFNEKYVGDASDAYSQAQDKLLELERLEKLRTQQYEERQRKLEEQQRQAELLQQQQMANSQSQASTSTQTSTTTNNNSTNIVSDDAKMGYIFTLYDPRTAKQLKDILDQNGLKYHYEIRPLQ